MKVMDPEVEVFLFNMEAENQNGDPMTPQEVIERVARTCYKSHDRICEGSDGKLIKHLVNRGHYAMLEFGEALAIIKGDRGLSHELVRHRMASFAQESTRWCNYSKGKFGGEITVIRQPDLTDKQEEVWEEAIESSERYYMSLIGMGVKPEVARSVLPIGLRAEICIKANLREWRHIFKMRCSPAAHPIIRGIMLKVLSVLYTRIPAVYEDLAKEFLDV